MPDLTEEERELLAGDQPEAKEEPKRRGRRPKDSEPEVDDSIPPAPPTPLEVFGHTHIETVPAQVEVDHSAVPVQVG